MTCATLSTSSTEKWQPDGDTFINLLFGLATTAGVLLSLFQTVLVWQGIRLRERTTQHGST